MTFQGSLVTTALLSLHQKNNKYVYLSLIFSKKHKINLHTKITLILILLCTVMGFYFSMRTYFHFLQIRKKSDLLKFHFLWFQDILTFFSKKKPKLLWNASLVDRHSDRVFRRGWIISFIKYTRNDESRRICLWLLKCFWQRKCLWVVAQPKI